MGNYKGRRDAAPYSYMGLEILRDLFTMDFSMVMRVVSTHITEVI